jgi:HD-GYP domain-containing protein (c-di-GMP phosphodiesterase class II)/methanogenic corrinoid protein MtbC1
MASAAWESNTSAEAYLASGEVAIARGHARSTRLRARIERAVERLPILGPRRIVLPVLSIGAAAALLALAGTAVAPLAAAALLLLAGGLALGWSAGSELRSELERDIEDRSHELWHALAELEVAQAETVRKLSMAVEFRDEDTGAHIERIGRLSALLAEQVRMDERFCSRILHAAPLHDVGKVAIPDAVLLKPGPLTQEERAIVEAHAEEGYRLLARSSSSILELAATIALSHHERWDGSGYPRGLAREEIPLEGRIVAVTDVFDALTSDRVYRKAYPLDQAIALMREQRGRHFDPYLLDAFFEVIGATGADARARIRANPHALIAGLREVFGKALEQGDPELAEGTIAQAIEDGLQASSLHAELIAPAVRRIYALRAAGDIDGEGEQRAIAIARRVLATLFRLMISGVRQDRERILVAGIEGERQTLELQMAHDQLAAAGYRAALITDLSPERLSVTLAGQAPAAVLLAGSSEALAPALVRLIKGIAEEHPQLPVLVGGAAAAKLGADAAGVITVEPLERCLPAVESLLGARTPVAAASR